MKIKMCLVFILISVFAAGLGAQSRINGDTFELFGNDADVFMDPNDYGTVEFDQFFSYLQYDADIQDRYNSNITGPGSVYGGNRPAGMGNDILSAGYAGRFGSLYIGATFQGNLYEKAWMPGTGSASVTHDLFSVLVGTESIGGITLTAGYSGTEQNPSGGPSVSAGGLIFGGGWGKNFTLSNGLVLKPEVNFLYTKVDITGIAQEIEDAINNIPGGGGGTPSLDYIIGLDAEADLELPYSGSARPSISAGYSFGYAKVDGVDMSGTSHGISGSYNRTYDLTDRFSAGFGFGLDIILVLINADVGGGVTMKGTVWDISPFGRAGFSYQFNSPFSVHAGIQLSHGIYNGFSFKAGGQSISNNSVGPFDVLTRAGGSFQPTENLAVDFSYFNAAYDSNLGMITLAVRFKK
ncbi:MAG: hypothetical protein LBH35_01175 [Treponema sp.]|jgi:hypothetical protein|nr:hypothetical protein [Treponema sp.]